MKNNIKTTKDYCKVRVTFTTDEGKFCGNYDDEMYDTMVGKYKKLFDKLEKKGYSPCWYIEPINQKFLRVGEHGDEHWKVEADLVLLSKELDDSLTPIWEANHYPSDSSRIMGWNYIVRPHVEKALGRKWTTPPCRFCTRKQLEEFLDA